MIQSDHSAAALSRNTVQQLPDTALQNHLLQGVSRTFALTIPQLPATLAEPVANAYLLCRIIDTIEDDAGLEWTAKRQFCQRFVSVVDADGCAESFAADLASQLSVQTPAAERELIELTPRVIAITHRLRPAQTQALARCVRLMAQGMIEFQQHPSLAGLDDQPQMNRYCYFVAGVVGEMLTELFCDYSPAIARHHSTLMPLSVSFGQGLQMTNILKDIWEDRQRGACWLPHDLFAGYGCNLEALSPDRHDPGFERGLGDLIALARNHLRNALTYTLLIPRHETGIRNFCLWSIGMALLTLQQINRQRDFRQGRQVKISRTSVRAVVLGSRLTVSANRLLKVLFGVLSIGLPRLQSRRNRSDTATGVG